MHQEEVSEAQQQIDGFRTLKPELDTDLQAVLEKIGALKIKIKSNVRGKDNPRGLLTRDADLYLACLTIQHEKLEGFYREDEAQWTEHLETVKAQASQMQAELEELMQKHTMEL